MARLAADMSTTVKVAPREIHDLVYRASRVAGCDPGTAGRIAENVTFAEIHLGEAARAFCEALEVLDLPLSGWVTAPDTLLAAEVTARAGGVASARLDPAVPMAAVAATLQQSLERGIAAVGIDDRVRGDTTVGVVGLRTVDAGAGAASRARRGDTHRRAHRLGVAVDRGWFRRLEAAAAGYLVAEATLDDVC